jgi:transcriptional regulator with GAF, ATPase, and Fis domain
MSSFPLPDNSSITSSPDEPCRNAEHSTLPFRPITPSPKEAVDHEPELQAILEEAMEGTGATGAAIALSAPEGVYCRASIGVPAPEAGTRLRAGIGLTGLCLSTGEILLCNDTNTDRRANSKLCKETGIRSALVLPIKQHAKVVGVLELLSANPNAFNQHQATALSMLADRVLQFSLEPATKSDRCLDELPSKDTEAVRNPRKLLAHANVLDEHNRLPFTDAAGAP